MQQKLKKAVVSTARIIQYANYLAGNDKSTRDKAIKSLKKWLADNKDLNELDLSLIWKGLFYSMWMSDKPLIQEECAENISQLMHSLDTEGSLLYFNVALQTVCNEWFGIDQLRLDKFSMLLRRLLRQALQVLRNNKWNVVLVRKFGSILLQTVLSIEKLSATGLLLHFIEIFMEEVAKMTDGQVHPNAVTEFLVPFVKYLAAIKDQRVIKSITKHVFHYLIEQSPAGFDYKEKFDAWKNMGFPGGSINCLQKVRKTKENEESDNDVYSDDDDEEETEEMDDVDELEEEKTGLDARAGRVNVLLPQIKFSPKMVSKVLRENKFVNSNTRSRKAISLLIEQFDQLAEGKYPLGVQKVKVLTEKPSANIRKSALNLIKFEQKLHGKRNNRKRKLITSTTATTDSPNDENGDENDFGKAAKRARKMSVLAEIDEKTITPANIKYKREQKQKLKEKPNNKTKRMIADLSKGSKESKKSKKSKESKENTNRKLCGTDVVVRNSGTWFISDVEEKDNAAADNELKQKVRKDKSVATVRRNGKEKVLPGIHDSLGNVKKKLKVKKSKIAESKEEDLCTGTKQQINSSDTSHDLENGGRSPKNDSTTKSKKNELPAIRSEKLFEDEWSRELKDGESEFFVPSKKYLAKQHGATLLKGKNKQRRQSDSLLLLNPFAQSTPSNGHRNNKNSKRSKSFNSFANLNGSYNGDGSSSSSSKKVKINLRMNRSQEFVEHLSSVKQSPGNPFDASRKPAKPVIKSSAVLFSPINPFHSSNKLMFR